MISGALQLWREGHPQAMRALGIPVLLIFVVDLASKDASNMVEVLWSCYWASALIAVGLVADSGLLVAAGFIFQAAVGGPVWTLGMIYYHNVQLISVLLHVVPPLAGLLYVSGMPQIPKAAPAIAWLLHPASLCASLLWRNEELNVNFSNAVWPPFAGFFRLPVFQALLVLTSLVLVFGLSDLLDTWLCSRGEISSKK
jgi:hypothetical protein